MAGTEELMSRLQQLEDSYYGDKEATRQKAFFDQYGSRFSNNQGLGMAILNELDRRGVDTSAADEAVTGILDQLRMECNEIITAINGIKAEAMETMEKVSDVADAVQDAVADNPNGDVPLPPSEEAPMPEEPAPEMPPEAPVDVGAEEFTPPTEEVPVSTTLSDARMKRIKGIYSAAKSKKSTADSYKPSAGILSAAQGGREC